MIVLVSANAKFGNERRRRHFEQIELRGDLESRSGIFWQCVKSLNVGDNFLYRNPAITRKIDPS